MNRDVGSARISATSTQTKRNDVTARRRGRNWASASASLLGAGLILSASASSVSARPAAVLQQADEAPVSSNVFVVGNTLGSHASISGDGKFVVFQGAPQAAATGDGPDEDGRSSTIFLTNREDGVTVEISPLPAGLRAGDSVRPVISGDGCTVAMVTEMQLDVFRDDDRDDRWDVYRTVLPHCDGTIGNWELVSTRTDGSGLARDDVRPDQTPAVSRSGSDVAFVHPDDRLFEAPDVNTISVVDLTKPATDVTRSTVVAGAPADRPNTTFIHVGIDQPAMSDDGRYVAYRSDARSEDAVPVWGSGPFDGQPATKQVFVWDRLEDNPFSAVRLVSALPTGEPTAAGAGEPTISRDGRVIAFSSPDQGLVPAAFAPCADACPSQIYRLDRDIDDDEIYDEDAATELTLISAEPESSALPGVRVAGTAASRYPALSADGHTLAFVSNATNLQLLDAPGGGEAGDGDILVSDSGRAGLRRVTVSADGVRPTIGAHSRPQLSDSGRISVFDTLAAADLLPGGAPVGRQVVAVSSPPELSLADADVGTTVVGLESAGWFVGLVNDGPSAFDPARVTVSDSRFQIDAENSTCVIGTVVPAGSDCKVQFTFTPTSEAPVNATLTISEDGFEATSITSTLSGTGGEPSLQLFPGGADVAGEIPVGSSAPEFLFDVSNIGFNPTEIRDVEIRGAHAQDFSLSSTNCADRPLNPRASCAIGITFTPTDDGRRTALIEVFAREGQSTSVIIAGDAVFVPVLDIIEDEVRAGAPFVMAGNDYPANTPLVVTFADGQGQSIDVDVVSNDNGDFFVSVPVDVNELGGRREVVVQSVDGVAAATPVEVIADDVTYVGLPGFGLG